MVGQVMTWGRSMAASLSGLITAVMPWTSPPTMSTATTKVTIPSRRTTTPGAPLIDSKVMVASSVMRPARFTISPATGAGRRPVGTSSVVGPAVAEQDDVRREQRHDRVQVAEGGGGEEGLGDAQLVGVGCGPSGRCRSPQLASGPYRLLADRRLALVEDLGHRHERLVEHVGQQHGEPLGRRQLLEHQEERRCQRVGEGGHLGRVRRHRRVGAIRQQRTDQRLGQPGAHIPLLVAAADPQAVDAEP